MKVSRLSNEFSQQEIQPLDQALVTSSANTLLASWGIPTEAIEELSQVILPSFRYDLVSKRVARLSNQEAFLMEANGQQKVLIPHFIDLKGKMTGACGSLAIQFLTCGAVQDWYSRVNSYLLRKNRLTVSLQFCKGYSPTHFTAHAQNLHMWIGLTQKDSNSSEIVTIDPSFQRISSGNNGYKYQNIASIPSTLSNIVLTGKIPVGKCKINLQSEELEVSSLKLAIGVSHNRRYVYTIGFALDKEHIRQPIVGRIRPNGTTEYFMYQDGQLLPTPFLENELDKRDNSSVHEITEILLSLNKLNLNLNNDLNHFPYPIMIDREGNVLEPGMNISLPYE